MQQDLFQSNGNLLPTSGDIRLYPGFLPLEKADQYMQQLSEEVNWKQEPIKIFGKEVMQPRLTAWYSDPGKSYSYSGITMKSRDWTSTLREIRESVEKLAQLSFNSALLNFYRNGNDNMGWHRDNEKELGTNPVIASVNLGATRNFQLRQYADKEMLTTIALNHGSLLIMQGETQHYWEHRVPKTNLVNAPRINITFRLIR